MTDLPIRHDLPGFIETEATRRVVSDTLRNISSWVATGLPSSARRISCARCARLPSPPSTQEARTTSSPRRSSFWYCRWLSTANCPQPVVCW